MKNSNENLLTQNQFIGFFPGTRFRYIHDVNGQTIQGNDKLDLTWNQKGYGVFFTVNGFPPTGSADQSQLLSLNGNYVDFDVDATLSQEEKEKLIQEAIMSGMEEGVPAPTIINRTQKGVHLIWLYLEHLVPTSGNIEKWRNVQKRLVQCFKGDKAAIDPSRVLRVPYTLHLKDPNNPFEIRIMYYKPEAKYTLEELDIAVPEYSENESNGNKTSAIEILREGVKVGEGMRHMAMAQVAGLVLKDATTPKQVEIARLALYGWDRTVVKSPEPFHQRKKELDNTIEGILEREIASRETGATPTEKAPIDKLHIWTIGEILSHDFGEEDWLIESLISKQGITALSGHPGDFKTWVSIHKALCVARGGLVFGKYKATQGGVLVIDEEDHLRLLKKRLRLLGAKETDNIYYLSQNGIKVDNEETSNAILEIIKEKNIKLLILDSLVRVHQQDENDAKGMAKVFSWLQKITGAGASILFTHHHRKQQGFGKINPGQSMRGSSDILAAVDCHIVIEKKQDEDCLIIRQTKLRQDELLKPFEVKILKDALDDAGKPSPSGFEYAGDHDEKKKKAEEAAEALTDFLSDGMKSRDDIHVALSEEFGKTAIDDGIKIAEKSGQNMRVPKEELEKDQRKKAYYRLPPKDYSNLPGTDSYYSAEDDDLPVSQLSIEAGKQEDEKGDLTETPSQHDS
ncbi:MAG: hypothetical protein UX71_C0002G0006 [Parcubacteria group bacterium GW2011_GWA1_47_10]|uniref:Primase C-terminal 1 domain-containing protein n=1 Tax=Candidatus Zambryskibacteria bacterium RIFCSPHIGHO2_01_FULL_46_25 TaxID=1802738 RepID=A0A1G2T076_9BACT|nr:MAG: hypothetical protein UX71_C0002G0006 [Parcubacteria group bacterium GW2011_GWA1_47_10]OHA90697.1 MAG: hypothetical protein A2838_03235 [Candidatus Zambryskibacteria bacterium RIFCSPHIGHO2_01_FULL_46_25]OHB07340.1 MAG: hypothetical protein A3A31_02370 [Candidatus Zambryskibacteria bacterium RIFCSPLOWO2_01_FULL_48_25]